MKKICIALVLFCAFFKMFADDDDKLKLAVMDLEDLSGKLSEETLSGASEYFRIIFAQTNRYIIISKDRQKEQISGLRKKYNTDPTYKSCTDKNCQIQLGQALSADLIVKTSVSFFAGSYTLASELIDLEKEATIIAATEEYDGSPQALKAAIRNNVAKIVEAEKKENEAIAAQEKKESKPKSNSKDSIACEYARSEASTLAWETYLKKYPNGECAAEAKDELDKTACKTAEKKNSEAGWREYLKEFPDGKCEFKAQTTLQKFEKEKESQEKAELEEGNFYSRADKKLAGIFSGRWNLGLGVAFNTPNKIGLGTGLDFNFKVFEKPYGGGAGNLFIGLGFDFKYYLKTADEGYSHSWWDDVFVDEYGNEYYYDSYKKSSTIKNNIINIPIQANFGYEFKINNHTLRYVGLWSSFGIGVDIDKLKDTHRSGFTYTQLSFAWDIIVDMIFKNGMLLNIGVGGNKSKEKAWKGDDWNATDFRNYWRLDHTYLTFGTGVIF